MIFNELKLHNWIPYNGPSSIVFSKIKGKPFTFIRANNRVGKTSILRAFRWVFYGDTGDKDYQKPNEILNSAAKQKGDNHFSVTLTLTVPGRKIVIERSMTAKNGHKNATSSDYKPTFTVIVNGKVLASDPDLYVNGLLSKEISDFFFFDGEKLMEYEKLSDQSSASGARLRGQIEKVIQIPYLQNAISDVKFVHKKIAKKIENETTDYIEKKMLTQLAELREKERELTANKRELEEIVVAKKIDFQRIDEQMREKKVTIELIEQRDKLQNNLVVINKRLESQKGIFKTETSSVWEVFASKLIEKDKQRLFGDEEKLKDEIRISRLDDAVRVFIEKTIEHGGECHLCQSELSESKLDELKAQLIPRRNQNLEKVEAELSELQTLRNKILTTDRTATLRDQEKKYLEDKFEVANTELKIERLKTELSNHANLDVGELQNNYQTVENQITGLENDIEDCYREMHGPDAKGGHDNSYGSEGIIMHGKKLGALLTDTQNKKPERDADQQLFNYTQRVEFALQEALDGLLGQHKNEVQAKSAAAYKKMIGDTVTKVRINQGFGLEVIDESGRKFTPSSAQNQIVALALLQGLKETTEIQGPLVIDTPFGRVDDANRKRIAKCMQEMSDQVILLVHDGEVAPGSGLEDAIAPHVGAWYTINKDTGNEFISTIDENIS